MAEFEFESPHLKIEANTGHGGSFDGVDKASIAKYGLYYTKTELLVLGGGDEDKGLKKIAKAIFDDDQLMVEGEEFEPYRPLQETIEQLTYQDRSH